MCFPLFPLCKCDHATLSCFEHSKGRKPGKHEGASRTAHTAVEITVGWRKGWRQNSRKIALWLPYQQRTVHSSPGKSQPANFPLFEQMLQRLWRVHREWHPVGRDVNSFVGLKCTKKQCPGQSFFNMHRNLTKWPTSFCSRASEPESGHEATGACTWPPREWTRAVLPCDFLIS